MAETQRATGNAVSGQLEWRRSRLLLEKDNLPVADKGARR